MDNYFTFVCIGKSLTKLEVREPRLISDVIKHRCLDGNEWETNIADAVSWTLFLS